jgi:hypothetical protein
MSPPEFINRTPFPPNEIELSPHTDGLQPRFTPEAPEPSSLNAAAAVAQPPRRTAS